jgi:hypothetical protein
MRDLDETGATRDLLRRILREHAPDDAERELAQRVAKHLERSGFELDEQFGICESGRLCRPILRHVSGKAWSLG